MRVVTSTTLFNDAVGKRLSITYSEIDDQTGEIKADNKRVDRIVTDQEALAHAEAIAAYAAQFIG